MLKHNAINEASYSGLLHCLCDNRTAFLTLLALNVDHFLMLYIHFDFTPLWARSLFITFPENGFFSAGSYADESLTLLWFLFFLWFIQKMSIYREKCRGSGLYFVRKDTDSVIYFSSCYWSIVIFDYYLHELVARRQLLETSLISSCF